MLKKPMQLLVWIAVLLLFLLSIYVAIKLKTLWNPLFDLTKAILVPLSISVFITYLLLPVIEKLHGTGLPRTLSLLIIYILFFGSIGFGLYKGIPILLNQLYDLSENIPMFAETYNGMLKKIHNHTNQWPDGMHERIDRFIGQMEEFVANAVEKAIRSMRILFDYLLIGALIPFLVFYLVKDINLMKKTVWYFTPSSWRKRGWRFLKDVDESLGGYIRGQLLVCVIIGSCAGVTFWLFHIPYPLILGLVIALTNVIPYFGPFIGAVPALLIAAAVSSKAVIIVLATIAILQFIEGNILGPLIVGKSLNMHPVAIMLALLAGGELAGVVGMIIAVPAASILKIMFAHLISIRAEH